MKNVVFLALLWACILIVATAWLVIASVAIAMTLTLRLLCFPVVLLLGGYDAPKIR